MPSIRIYPFYGFIGAPFPRGIGYSRGLDVLGAKLAALPGVTMLPGKANWLTQGAFIRDARRHPQARKVVIGHSMGVYAATRMAAKARDIAFDLVIAFEPVPAYGTLWLFPCAPLHANVKNAICFRSTVWLNPIGHGRLRKARDFTGDLQTVGIRRLHQNVVNDLAAHEMCVDAVRKLAAQG